MENHSRNQRSLAKILSQIGLCKPDVYKECRKLKMNLIFPVLDMKLVTHKLNDTEYPRWKILSFDGILNFFTLLPPRFGNQLKLFIKSPKSSIPKPNIDGLFFYIDQVTKLDIMIGFLHQSQLELFIENAKANKKIDMQVIYPPKVQHQENEDEIETEMELSEDDDE